MSEFHFLRPYWLLALLPVLWLLWQFWQRHYSSRGWRAVCDSRLLPYLLVEPASRQRRWPLLLLAMMLLLSIFALAGPVWKKLKQPVFREQSALVIVLDLSRSMDAEDIKPSRLARARLKVIDILRRRKEGQTALVVYAADAFTVSPLTEDSNTIVAMDKTLTTDLMPAQGSKPEKALRLATKLLRQDGVSHGDILLITDGVNSTQVQSLARQVTSQGHRLFVLGVGTKEGAPINIAGGGFVKDRSGNIVIARLDPVALEKVAQAGGGRFHLLTTDDSDLTYIFAGINGRRIDMRAKATSFIADEWQEEGPWLLILVLPFAALAFRRGYIALLLICCLPMISQPAHAATWDQLWQRPDQRAAKVLEQHKPDVRPPSAKVFNDPEWKASAYYRAGDYQNAVKQLQGINKPDALYNKGNALAKMGKLQEAVQAYDQALKEDPGHADAKYNRKLVEQQLKKQKQQKSTKKSQKQKQQKNSSKQKKSGNKQHSQQGKSGKQKQAGGQGQDQTNKEKNKKTAGQQQHNQQQKDAGQQQGKANNEKQKQADQQQAKVKQQKSTGHKPEDKKQHKPMGQQQAKSEAQKPTGSSPKPAMADMDNSEKKEQQQANAQWLRRIPDDPGGLLRRKFLYQYQRQQQSGQAADNNHDEQQAW